MHYFSLFSLKYLHAFATPTPYPAAAAATAFRISCGKLFPILVFPIRFSESRHRFVCCLVCAKWLNYIHIQKRFWRENYEQDQLESQNAKKSVGVCRNNLGNKIYFVVWWIILFLVLSFSFPACASLSLDTGFAFEKSQFHLIGFW